MRRPGARGAAGPDDHLLVGSDRRGGVATPRGRGSWRPIGTLRVQLAIPTERAACAATTAICTSPSDLVKKSPSHCPRCSVRKRWCVRFTKRRRSAQCPLRDDVRPRTTADQPAAFTPARWCRDDRLLNTARTSERNKLVSCTSDPSSCSLREVDTRAAQQRARGRAGLAVAVLLGAACTGTISGPGQGAGPNPVGGGGTSGAGQGGGTSGSSQGGTSQSEARVKSEARVRSEARREPAALRPPSC